MATYDVVEKFVSINGEGTRAGQLAVFVRFAGCNLNCSFCDTKWANEKNVAAQKLTETEIVDYIKSTGVTNVTLTGGEPLLRDGMRELLEALRQIHGIYVEIETNGSVDIEEFRIDENFPAFTMDYKLPGSGMEQRMNLENFEKLKKSDTVKFVAGSRQDLERAKEVIDKNGLLRKCSVYFSPVFGRIEPREIVEFMVENRMNGVNMQLQMHKFIWEPDRKGV
jgi:7-carboxy-7-deazaguanine synthase